MKVSVFVMLSVILFTCVSCINPRVSDIEDMPIVQAEAPRIPVADWEDLETPEFALLMGGSGILPPSLHWSSLWDFRPVKIWVGWPGGPALEAHQKNQWIIIKIEEE